MFEGPAQRQFDGANDAFGKKFAGNDRAGNSVVDQGAANPPVVGGSTFGPPCSCHIMLRRRSWFRAAKVQVTATLPLTTESEPYFAALAASS